MRPKVFGKHPAGNRLARIEQSPNYREGSFQNLAPTSVNPNKVSALKMLKDFASKPKTVVPGQDMPAVKTDLLSSDPASLTVVWFGHSSYLISYKGFNVLIDPVLSGNASPVALFGKPFKGTNKYSPDDLPAIDLLLITHDHYDHLDYRTITQIDSKVKQIVTPLGVGAHLEHWGVAPDKITELDWWDAAAVTPEVTVTATPARHFSGRGLARAKTLWTSYALQLYGYKLFIGGDSGYDAQFKVIGDRFQGFDLALLECGQYGEDWPQIHMLPEETVKAAKELRAAVLLPVHWAKFTLSLHAWNEPIKRLAAAAQKENQPFVAPRIGEPYRLGEDHPQVNWWAFE
ncbi:MBL fold metallo-hydrolase [Pontibacter liquoris]|uniref:MBL fold metallo-hydrolase n=1 Tax=Pontibacter liquoris TaxID=2905677 RepID=UPI001FA7B375|nr:MBL fold metallo-hydrolase [Pontibacter liquoris]